MTNTPHISDIDTIAADIAVRLDDRLAQDLTPEVLNGEIIDWFLHHGEYAYSIPTRDRVRVRLEEHIARWA